MDNNETVNQENNGQGADQGKTFTQAEVNSMIETRLARERSKYAAYGDLEELKEKAARLDQLEEGQKSELQKATEKAASLQKELDGIKNANRIREIREKVSEETGVPAGILTAETEEGCQKQAKEILEFAKPSGYPNIRDGGELQTPVGKKSTRDQFAEWADKVF